MGLLDLRIRSKGPSMKLGYNTNGLPHHRLTDAIELLVEEGYKSVAITLDAGALDPYQDAVDLASQTAIVKAALDRHQLGRVVETGARFLLNPRKKHDPTLMDPDPKRRAWRIDFLTRSIDLSAALEAEAVSFWSGALPDDASEDEAFERIATALKPVIAHAEKAGVRIAFEPEPGMFIDTFDRFARLDAMIQHPLFDLTVDLGHVHCIEPGEAASHLPRWTGRIANVHIEDMKRGIHDHLMFGEGTMDFPPILKTLRAMGYDGGLHVELSRHGHMAVEAVQRSAAFLKPLLAGPIL
jgi:sugar phosphate isomerase/epimerase